jgi:hypothetical protein
MAKCERHGFDEESIGGCPMCQIEKSLNGPGSGGGSIMMSMAQPMMAPIMRDPKEEAKKKMSRDLFREAVEHHDRMRRKRG